MNLDILDKSYDIRGVYPSDLDEEFYYKLGVAFAVLNATAKTFAVGCDSRLSSEKLKKSLISGILTSGKDVVDIGLCSTDMVYFASGKYPEVDIAMMITASHNPKEYNGLKSCFKYAVPINMKTFGKDVRDYFETGEFINSGNSGRYSRRDISDDFVEHICSFLDEGFRSDSKIVVDAGSGVAGVFMEKLALRLGFDLIPMYFEPDGNFPFHHPSPIEPENVEDMINTVKALNADLGVAFDGDADRMYICDEEGVIISGTITTAMIAEMMLLRHSGKKIIYNAVCGKIVSETIADNSGIGIKEKVGHVYIKERMQEDKDAIFGGEHSGHYYFRQNWNADSGVIAFAVVLELIAKSGKKPSELRKGFDKYHAITETNSKVLSVKDKLQELKGIYSDGEMDELDGLTVKYPDYWFNVRPSSNEPLLRLNLEADTEEIMNKRSKEVLDIIRG